MPRHFGGVSPVGRSDRTRVILLLGVFCLIIFSAIALVFLLGSQSSAPVQVTTTTEPKIEIKMSEVLVPVREIQSGEELQPEMFTKKQVPTVAVDRLAVLDFEEIRGQFAKSLIVAGQPLHRSYVTEIRPTNILTANIPDGYRAVTISVDAKSSVEGWARPGANVDIVWAGRIRGQPGVRVIVQNARVLSTERQTTSQPKEGTPVPSTVTLLVSAKDANVIQLAATTGTLSLSLRGDVDTGKGAETGSITLDDLLGAGGPSQKTKCTNVVVLDGQEWCLVDGELTPIAEVNKGKKAPLGASPKTEAQ